MQVANMQVEYKLEVCRQEPLEVCRQEPLEVCRQGLLEGCKLVVSRLEVCMQVVCRQEPLACIRSLDYQPPSQRQPRGKR
jgi:hypothetical protein